MQFVAKETSVGVSIGMRHISLAHYVMSTSVYVRIATAGTSTIISMTTLPRLAVPSPASLSLDTSLYYMYMLTVPPPIVLMHTLGHTPHSQFTCNSYSATFILFFVCNICLCFSREKKRFILCISYIVFIVLNCFFVVSTHAHTSRC